MFKITAEMMNKLEYNQSTINKNGLDKVSGSGEGVPSYTAVFVFQRSDIHAAIYHIKKCFEKPYDLNGIRYLFVQESCMSEFLEKLKSEMSPYQSELIKNEIFVNEMKSVCEKLDALNAEKIQPNCQDAIVPTIVVNFSQEFFATPTGPAVLTLKSFRTTKEACALANQEQHLKTASIWCENHAIAYELVQKLSFKQFYINCLGVGFDPLKNIQGDQNKSASLMKNSHLYEAIQCEDVLKYVVFPFGSTFAN